MVDQPQNTGPADQSERMLFGRRGLIETGTKSAAATVKYVLSFMYENLLVDSKFKIKTLKQRIIGHL